MAHLINLFHYLKQMADSQQREALGKNDTGLDLDADLYSVLNVPQTASIDEIRKSWKKQALSMHPDK